MSKYILPAPVTVADFYLRTIVAELEAIHETLAKLQVVMIPLAPPPTPDLDGDVIDLCEPRSKRKAVKDGS